MSNLNKALQQVYKQEKSTYYNSLTKEDLEHIIYSLTAGQVNWITGDDHDLDKKPRGEFEIGDLVCLIYQFSDNTNGFYDIGMTYEVLDTDYSDRTILVQADDLEMYWESMDYFELV